MRSRTSPSSSRSRIAYVGDSVTMDIGAATAAGLHPILLDPYDDHAGADFDRIASVAELARRLDALNRTVVSDPPYPVSVGIGS